MIETVIVETLVAAGALPVAIGTAVAVRRRHATQALPRVPSRRSTRALIAKLPHRHRREAKAIVALARDHDRRHGESRLDAYTAREALRSYLPETIEAYLAVPKDLRRRAGAGIPSPDEELARQLLILRSGLERLRDGDAELAASRMAQNRTFLDERFGAPPPGPPPQPTLMDRLSDAFDDFLAGF